MMINKCDFKCWCEFCHRAIEKEEKYLVVYKNAQRGTTRVNICKDCLIRLGVEAGIENKDIRRIKKEIILENLK